MTTTSGGDYDLSDPLNSFVDVVRRVLFHVPLDCALVLQLLYGVVVALTVRSDTGPFSRFEKGEVGSW